MRSTVKIPVVTIVLFCLSFTAQAGVLTYHQRIEAGLNGCTTIPQSTACATTVVYVTPTSYNHRDYNVDDILTLGIDHNNLTYYPDSMTCSVNLKIFQWDQSGAALPTLYQTLHVRYTPFTYTTYLDKAAFVFKNAYKDSVIIDTITVNGISSSGQTLPPNVYLDDDIQLIRYYDFIPYASIAESLSEDSLDINCDGIADEVLVSWPTLVGAEQYDLEWTFVNDYDTIPGTYLSSSSISYNFRFNSTRITTPATSYPILLAYEHGYLIFRVRGVGNDMYHPSITETGVWSLPDSSGVSSLPPGSYFYVVLPHEADLKDWQYNATYAEEGKKKEVITYYDGSLRSREAVTKMNSDSNVLVGQTIYDNQGRPAITVLPVPVQFPTCGGPGFEPSIHYYPNFNLDAGSNLYSRLDFDVDSTGDSCSSIAAPMNTISGASNYYSSFNPRQYGWQAYVPDAQQFPFSEVQYTPDNTGRIRAQGGVGPQFQLGGHHETDYFYGQPNQVELDRMFGEEVGYASHYKKNVVVDPNGQSSISYLDQEGRTIATCLAGYPGLDSNRNLCLDTLPSTAHQNMCVDLLATNSNGYNDNNTVNVEGNAIVFNTQLTVAYTSPYVFKYFMQIDTMGVGCLNTICMSCVYDLKIQVTNDCGEVIHSIDTMEGHFSLSGRGDTVVFNTTCSSSPIDSNTREFTVNLNPGNYTVSKILTVDTSALQFYEQAYLDSLNNTCVKTPSYFQNSYVADTCNCHLNCATCIASLGSRDNFVASGKGSAEEYDYLYQQCQQPCKPITECDIEYQQLLQDVSPDGQYGQYLTTTGVEDPTQFPLSVFNTGNQLPANIHGRGNWHYPVITLNGNTYYYYVDELGNRSTISLSKTSYNGFLPMVLDSSSAKVIYNASTNSWYTYPENLKYFQDFRNSWASTWNQSLVQYHPEYCYYKVCQQYENVQSGDTGTSEGFDERMIETNTMIDASTNGFIIGTYTSTVNPLDKLTNYFVTGNPQTDPFFIDGIFNLDFGTPSVANYFKSNYLDNYITIDGIKLSMPAAAALAARAGTSYGGGITAADTAFGTNFYGYTTWMNDSIQNKEWTYFKNYYYASKQQVQKAIEDHYTLYLCSGYNGCIGGLSFPWTTPLNAAGQETNPEQPCSTGTYALYASKQMRFSNQNSIPDSDENGGGDVAYQMYLQTGQCPLATELMGFLNSIAQQGKLKSTDDTLTNNVSFSYDLWQAMVPALPVTNPGPGYMWSTFDTTGGTLSTNILNPLGGVNCSISITIAGTGVTNWEQILGFSGLSYTGTSGGLDYFTMYAQVKNPPDSIQPYHYYEVTGSSCVNIHNCTFPMQCQPNQFASDLQNLQTVLASTGMLTGANVSLETSTYIPYLTPTIVNSIGPPNNNLEWNYVSPNEFDLFDAASTTEKIKIYFTSYNPTSFTYTSLPSIKMFSGITSAYQNNFTENGLNALGSTLVSISGNVVLDSNSVNRGISLGTCSLPTPVLCQGAPYQNLNALSSLLSNVLSKKPYTGDINLMRSSNFTAELQSYFPAVLDSTSSLEDSVTIGNKFFDTLKFVYWVYDTTGPVHKDSTACPFYITRTDSANAVNPATSLPGLRLSYSDLVSVQDLTACGDLVNGNLVDFYFIGIFEIPLSCSGCGFTLIADTVRGTSCIPLENCGCNGNSVSLVSSLIGDTVGGTYTPVPLTANALHSRSSRNSPISIGNNPWRGQAIDSLNVGLRHSLELSSGIAGVNPTVGAYNSYKSAVTSLNTRMGWTTSNPRYITPVTFTSYCKLGYDYSLRTLNNYMRFYDSTLDNNSLVKAPQTFVNNYGNRTNCTMAYSRYLAAISQYNLRATSVSGATHLTPMSDSAFYCNFLADSISLWINYLHNLPTVGNNPVAEVSYLTSLNCIPTSDNPYAMLYESYVAAYLKYSKRHNIYNPITPLFSYGAFADNGLFTADYSGYNVMQGYIYTINHSVGNPGPPPSMRSNFGRGPLGSCNKLYHVWLNYVITFNHTHGAIVNHDIMHTMSFGAFDSAGYCHCIVAYLNYLETYLNPPRGVILTYPAITINNFGPCVDTGCHALYDRWVEEVDSFNNSAYARAHGYDLTILYRNYFLFAAAGLCNCAQNYLIYLEGFITPSGATAPPHRGRPLNINFFPLCDTTIIDTGCKGKYEQWVHVIDSFNLSAYATYYHYHLTLPYKSYAAFLNAGLCNCAGQYLTYLRQYLNPILSSVIGLPRPININAYGPCDAVGTDSICKVLYSKWLMEVDSFNHSAYAHSHHFYLTLPYHSFAQFVAAGLCNCVQAYIRYLHSYLSTSATSLPLPLNISFYGPCDSITGDTGCAALYQKWINGIVMFNNSPYAHAYHDSLEIIYSTLNQFEAADLCGCIRQYLIYLHNYTALTIPIGSGIAPPVNINAYGPCDTISPDTCSLLYRYWVAMVDSFNVSNYATTYSITLPVPYLNAASFGAIGFCSCAASYIDYLAQYLSSTPPTNPPYDIQEYEPCINGPDTTCLKLYRKWRIKVDSFNTSPIAVANHDSLPIVYWKFSQFENAGLCKCIKSYLNYLSGFIPYSGGSLPVSITQFGPCDSIQPDTGCQAAYQEWVNMVDSFDVSPWAVYNGYYMPLSYADSSQFDAAGNCSCVRSYLNYLQQYLPFPSSGLGSSPPAPVPIENYTTCDTNIVDTVCLYQYYQWSALIDSFNLSPWARRRGDSLPFTYPYFNQFVAAQLCSCVPSYITYLEQYLPSPHGFVDTPSAPVPIEMFGPCDSTGADTGCMYLFNEWIALVDSFNVSNWAIANHDTLPISYGSYNVFSVNGYCSCVSSYLSYLGMYLPFPDTLFLGSSPPPPLPIEEYGPCGNDTTCLWRYYAYVEKVDSFNSSPWARRAADSLHVLFTDAQFVDSGLCACISSYLNYLSAYIPGPDHVYGDTAMPLTIIQFGPCDSVLTDTTNDTISNYDCAQYFLMYQEKVDSFNTSAYASAYGYSLSMTYSSFSSFYSAGLCNCIVPYLVYLSNYLPPSTAILSNIGPPLNILEFGPCDSIINDSVGPCDSAYAYYINAVNTYNAFVISTRDTLPLITTIYNPSAFTTSGYCYCVASYVAMLQSLENGTFTGPGFNVVSGSRTIKIVNLSGDSTIITTNSFISSYLDIGFACENILTPPCIGSPPVDSLISPPYYPTSNPCVTEAENNDTANANYAYGQYMDSMMTVFRTAYISHCLSPVESLITSYSDMQFHYTLYYYDQGGNLVRTIPPQGVQLLPFTSYTDPLERTIIGDRTNDRHSVYTDHVLGSDYLYNSLNQLTKQAVPDADNMQIFQYSLADSLDPNLVITGIQFTDVANGYLSGYVPGGLIGKRGCLYKTFDGGYTWRKFNVNIGADLNRAVMISPTTGYIAADYGLLLYTADGGNSWDILPLATDHIAQDLHGIAYNPTNGILAVAGKGVCFAINTSGNTFTAATTPVDISDSIRSVTYDTVNNVFYAIGDSAGYGVIYWADRYALVWTKISNLSTLPINKILFLSGNSSHGYAAGDDGLLLHTTDQGMHWFPVGNFIKKNFKDIFFGDDTVGISIIDSAQGYGILYITSDMGETWQRFSPKGAYYNAMSFYRDSSSHTYKGVAVGRNGIMTRIVANPTLNAPYFGVIPINIPPGNYAVNFSTVFAQAMPDPVDSVYILAASADWDSVYYTSQCFNSEAIWHSLLISSNPVKCSFVIDNGYMLPTVIDAGGNVHTLINSGGAIPLSDASSVSVTTTSDITEHGTTNGADTLYSFDGSSSTLYYFLPNGTGTELNSYSFSSSGSTPAQLSSLAYSCNNSITGIDSANEKIYTGTISGGVTWTDVSTNTHPLSLREVSTVKNGSSADVYASGDYGTMIHASVSSTSAFPFSTIWLPVKQHVYAVGAPHSTNPGLFAGRFDSVFAFTYSGSGNTFSTLAHDSVPNKDTINDLSIYGKQAYLAGNSGSVLYISNTTSLPSIATAANGGATNFNGVYFYPGGSAYAVGTNGVAWMYGGLSGLQLTNLYPPAYNGLSFSDVNHGFAVGDNGTIRRTDNAGVTWQVVRPAVDVNGVPDFESVWTIGAGNAVVCGTGYFIGQTTSNNTCPPFSPTYTYTPSYPTWNKIKFNTNSQNVGFVVGDQNQLARINLAPNAIVSVSAPPAFGGSNFKSLHVFRDTSFMAVGSFGKIFYHNHAGGYWLDFSFGDSAAFTWKDVYFKDDITGYLVGDSIVGGTPMAGDLFKGVVGGNFLIENTIGSHSIKWTELSMDDHYNITSPTYDLLSCIAMNGPYTGMIGGQYNGSVYTNTTPYPYARLFDDEGGVFSQYNYYDRLGRLVVSQNTKQHDYARPAYSYTLYDALNRITEVGQKTENVDNTDTGFTTIFGDTIMGFVNPLAISPTNLLNWVIDNSGPRTEVMRDYYDNQRILPLATMAQNELRNRVATATYSDTLRADSLNYNNAIHYNYDVLGNIVDLIQDNMSIGISAQRYKRINYTYDFLSGKPIQVNYENDSIDEFYQHYNYDADSRVTSVYSSKDSILWDNDANYFYYAHGPLARIELGDQQIQGIDYAYTLQGWIKGVNSDLLDSNRDMGNDGLQNVNNLNRYFARDAYGYSLKYFTGDYDAINTSIWNNNVSKFEANYYNSDLMNSRHDLYNGNITAMVTDFQFPQKYLQNGTIKPITLPQGTAYNYDQLNRLIDMKAYRNLDTSNYWHTAGTYDGRYHNWLTYDENGNIITQKRADPKGIVFDSLSYDYNIQSGLTIQNRLYNVNNAVNVGGSMPNQGTFNDNLTTINQVNNYRYTVLGELAKDSVGGIDTIIWKMNGKVWKIKKHNGDSIIFAYDANGNRLMKEKKGLTSPPIYTFYITDAKGNQLAIYSEQSDTSTHTMNYSLIEREIYGSSRLGEENTQLELIGAPPVAATDTFNRFLGLKEYELDNHLGNVMSVISDRKIPRSRDTSSGSTIDHYEADVLSSNDYYPYGMLEPGRNFNPVKYRYGFNKKEKDNETYGNSDEYDYGKRFYDPRLGRFLSIDPLEGKYPFLSPYQFSSDNPILSVDLDGKEYMDYKDAVIQIEDGVVKLNIDNCSGPTKSIYTQAVAAGKCNTDINGNPCIGIATDMAILSLSGITNDQQQTSGSSNGGDNGTGEEHVHENTSKTPIEAPVRKDGQPDRRFKGNKINAENGGLNTPVSTSPGAAGLATTMLAVSGINFVSENYNIFSVRSDINAANDQMGILKYKVMADVNAAIKSGIIPTQYLNTSDLGAIANVVLSGKNTSSNPELFAIGKKICNEISHNYKPTEYKFTNTSGHNSTTPNDATQHNENISTPAPIPADQK